MNNKCPKCGVELSPFYLKPNCPKCGVNIMQFGFEERLERDAEKAGKEWENAERLLKGIKASSIGSVVAVFRLISFFLTVAALLIPVYKIHNNGVNLIFIIKSIISGAETVFGNKELLVCFISFVAVIVLSLVCAVVSLFSYTANGFKRNIVFSAADILVFASASAAVVVNGGKISLGAAVILALQILSLCLHFAYKTKNSEGENINE